MSFEVNIDTLMYSPWVKVLVAHCSGPGGQYEYYDVSEDVTDCTVSRKVGDASDFSVKLLNNNGKYNNLFEPMDLVTIYATKEGNTTRLITGYMTNVSKFTLYPGDYSFRGKCSLYRLQKLYWDPYLKRSIEVFNQMGQSLGGGSYEQL